MGSAAPIDSAGEASSNLIILGIDPDSSGAIAALQWHLPSSTQAGQTRQPDPPGQSTAHEPVLDGTSSDTATAVLKGLDQPESNGSSGQVPSAVLGTQLTLQGATAEVMDIPCQLHKVGARSRRQAQHATRSKHLHVRQSTLLEPVCCFGGRQGPHGSVLCQSHVGQGYCTSLCVSPRQQKARQHSAPPESGCSLALKQGAHSIPWM